jgi:hypothetical protein
MVVVNITCTIKKKVDSDIQGLLTLLRTEEPTRIEGDWFSIRNSEDNPWDYFVDSDIYYWWVEDKELEWLLKALLNEVN